MNEKFYVLNPGYESAFIGSIEECRKYITDAVKNGCKPSYFELMSEGDYSRLNAGEWEVLNFDCVTVYSGSLAECKKYANSECGKDRDIIQYFAKDKRFILLRKVAFTCESPVVREKVIIGLEFCREKDQKKCHNCPYYPAGNYCSVLLAGDALAYIEWLEEKGFQTGGVLPSVIFADGKHQAVEITE